MSVYQETCYTLGCDDCHALAGEDTDGYVLHFTTDTDALTWLSDNAWTVTHLGSIRCRICSAVAYCNSLGHHFDPWRPCTCQGFHPDHSDGCPLIRTCEQCGHRESATLATLPTIEEPTLPGC